MLEQMIIAMAILLTIFHAELTESSSSCYLDKAQYREIKRVDENATAFVSCPPLPENGKTIILYKGVEQLQAKNLSDVHSNASQQRIQVHKQSSSVSYNILRTEANDTGLYECKITTEDTQNRQSVPQILIIKDALSPIVPPVTCPTDQTLLPVVGCVVIFLYNVFITVFSYYLRYKLKNTEPPENPYINTRPGGFRRH